MLIGDGMADMPIEELGNKTPLAFAKTPSMDMVAKQGVVGQLQTIPKGYEPGSDVANMSLMGYDPHTYFSGRSPIEAASLGIKLADDEIAFRCNLVHLSDGIMKDYCSGHIETEDSVRIISEFQEKLNSDTIKFYPGASYRHLLVIKGFPKEKLVTTPPHDISDREYASFIPNGAGEDILAELSKKAQKILKNSAVNIDRQKQGKTTVTDIWLWGQGYQVAFPTLKERYGLTGSVISAVDLVRGLGILAGLKVRIVEGATGYLGTNYAGKIAAAKEALSIEDFVYLHIEAPDETSHEGDVNKKIQAIEEFDTNIVKEILALQAVYDDLRILVLPDHATLISTKTHHDMSIPYTVCGKNIKKDDILSYSEESANCKKTKVYTGVELFDAFIKGEF